MSYSVSGTADEQDHTAQSGMVTFESGTQQIIEFSTFVDDQVESNESIIFSLNESQNIGASPETRFTITEANIAPDIQLAVTQNGTERLTVAQDEGRVAITATVTDLNPQDIISAEWDASELESLGATDLSGDNLSFAFDASQVPPGVYRINLYANDNGSPILTSASDVIIEVVTTLPVLSNDIDTDGDLIPDAQEGYADSDGDGIQIIWMPIQIAMLCHSKRHLKQASWAKRNPEVVASGRESTASDSNGLEIFVGLKLAADLSRISWARQILFQ